MQHQSRRFITTVALVLISAPHSYSQSPDVTFSTDYESGKPKTANFNFEGQPVGEGRDGFEAIIEKLRKVPIGASVVWGPDYSRCGACSGAEPACVPKFLYPDLWDELTQIAKERSFVLSSNYPSAAPIRLHIEKTNQDLIKQPGGPQALSIRWTNFRGPNSPHEAVLYQLNGKVVGRGDAGFDEICRAVTKLTPGAQVNVPQYVLGGRWAWESFTESEMKAHNDRLRAVVPFAARKSEFSDLLKRLQLRLVRTEWQVRSEAISDGADWGSATTVSWRS